MSDEKNISKTDSEIYKDVGKNRWPYVDEPRPQPRGRPGAASLPAKPGPQPRPVTHGEAADA